MTHAYAAGGTRRPSVLTAIVGLYFAILLVVLNDQVPVVPVVTREPVMTLVPPKPVATEIVPPDEVLPPEASRQVVEEPVLALPVIPPDSGGSAASGAGSESQTGASSSTGAAVDRMPASLRGKSGEIAAAVRSCYPAHSRRAGEEGQLRLAVTIDSQGQARSWWVAASTGFPRLDDAAPCVLDKLRFNAARENGRAVQSETVLPILFRLN